MGDPGPSLGCTGLWEGGSPGGRTWPAGALCLEEDSPSGRGWEGLHQAMELCCGHQYGCLFRKRENMVKAARGLSVGTMWPAP